MSQNFYTILTTVGKAKFANAEITSTNVDFTEFAVGDGNGSYPTLSENMTSLVNEVWRGNINQISGDPENSNWIVIEAVIDETEGPFNIRELGLFDDDGDLIAVGLFPHTYKPSLAEGSGKDLYIKAILEVSNTSVVTLQIDPAIVLATRKYVDDEIAALNVGNQHNSDGTHKNNIIDQANVNLTSAAAANGKAVRYNEFTDEHYANGKHIHMARTFPEGLPVLDIATMNATAITVNITEDVKGSFLANGYLCVEKLDGSLARVTITENATWTDDVLTINYNGGPGDTDYVKVYRTVLVVKKGGTVYPLTGCDCDCDEMDELYSLIPFYVSLDLDFIEPHIYINIRNGTYTTSFSCITNCTLWVTGESKASTIMEAALSCKTGMLYVTGLTCAYIQCLGANSFVTLAGNIKCTNATGCFFAGVGGVIQIYGDGFDFDEPTTGKSYFVKAESGGKIVLRQVIATALTNTSAYTYAAENGGHIIYDTDNSITAPSVAVEYKNDAGDIQSST